MKIKTIILSFLFIFSVVKSNNDNNILFQNVFSTITFSDRINYVLFAISENSTTFEIFNNLINGFIKYEQQWLKGTNKPDTCTTFTSFGGKMNLTSQDLNHYGQYVGYEELYNASTVYDVSLTAIDFLKPETNPCPSETTIESWMIVTDTCITAVFLSKLNQTFNNTCSMQYQKFALILPTKAAAQTCKNKNITTFVDFYSVENITQDDLESYTNMKAQHYSNTEISAINLFAIINQKNIGIIKSYIIEQIFGGNSECTNGSMIGYFSVTTSGTFQEHETYLFSLPLYFNEKNSKQWFGKNFDDSFMTKLEEHDENDRCVIVDEYFWEILREDFDKKQYNILIMDSLPPCAGEGLQWNLTKRHLEVFISSSNSTDTTQFNIISPDVHISNHVTFYNPEHDNFTNLIKSNTVCKTIVPQTNYDFIQASSSTSIPSTTAPSKSNTPVKWWIVGSVVILVVAFAIAFVIRCLTRLHFIKKREELQKTIQNKLEMSPLESQLSHDKRIEMQLNSKNVIIDFNIVLGKGSNATVYKAFLKGESCLHTNLKKIETSQYIDCDAAIKVPTTFDHDEIEEFVRELDALITVGHHPHISALLGWTLHHETPCLVTELAQTDLLTYVRSLRNQELPLKIFLSILWQITSALEYISSFSMVHRDIACRNILLTETKTAKLADFGLCCHCDESFTYRASLQKRLPLKWLSTEALIDRLFSEKSDIWSFGVLCYEMYSYGAVPYPALTNIEMLEFLQAGKRLEKPAKAPDEIYEIMLDCWKEQPIERPTFNELGHTFRTLLEKETVTYGYLTLNETKKTDY